jgi:predicted phosphoadenosine phosphosulfate sulfurtransferase
MKTLVEMSWSTAFYGLSKKRMDMDIFAITQERKELESCSCHHSKWYTAGRKNLINLIGSAADESGVFLINISNNNISKKFLHSLFSF